MMKTLIAVCVIAAFTIAQAKEGDLFSGPSELLSMRGQLADGDEEVLPIPDEADKKLWKEGALESSWIATAAGVDKKKKKAPAHFKMEAGDTVTNILFLKTFATVAKDKASDLVDEARAGSMSALVPFIRDYAGVSKHPFIDYAKLMAKYRAKWTIGVSAYVLKSLHHSIIKGKGAVQCEHPKGFCSLKHKAFGLQSRPNMMNKLLVAHTHFQQTLAKLKKNLHNADAKAAAAWLKHGSKGKFMTFERRVQNYYKSKVDACFAKTVKVGIKAEFGAFETSKKANHDMFRQIRVQVPAGIKSTAAALAQCGVRVPTARQIKELAKAKADHWLKTKKFSMSNAKDLISKFMKDRIPVYIKITTGDQKGAASSMVPKISIKGTKATKNTKLKIAKTKGKTTEGMVMAEGIGDFKSLTLKAGNMDSWYIKHVQVKQGKHGKWIQMCAQSEVSPFKAMCSGKWLDMKPFDKPKDYGLKKITGSKVSTTWTFTQAP